MSNQQDILVPDIGDFDDVEVIEVLVSPGDVVEVEDAIITLESDKASMDIPAPVSGTIGSITVAVGDKISQGSVIGTLEVASTVAAVDPQPSVKRSATSDNSPADAGGGYGGGQLIDVRVRILVILIQST